MLRNYYKVVEDFEAPVFVGEGLQSKVELLAVEKGDIIVDVKSLDNDWVVGKTIVSQKMLKIPKGCIEELTDDGNEDNDDNKPQMTANPSRSSREIKEDKKRISQEVKESEERPIPMKRRSHTPTKGIAPEGKRVSLREESGVKRESVWKESEARRESVRKESEVRQDSTGKEQPQVAIADGYVPMNSGIIAQPTAPPRARRSRDMTGNSEAFRSRGSDEGYNSSSHYSGDKPPDEEPPVARHSYCNTVVGEVPLLNSFRESPQRFSSPRPSIQDDEGYEIPNFTPRASVVNGEVASNDEKGVTLKFIFQRKSTNFDEREPMSPSSVTKVPLDAIGEHSESIYESWATDPKVSGPSDAKKRLLRERLLIALYLFISLVLALGIFFFLIYVARAAPLLCFTSSVNIFAIAFIALLTIGKKRWLCIGTLLAPSLFSRKVKVGLCVTLCVIVIAGPICNLSGNIKMVLYCKNIRENGFLNSTDSNDFPNEIGISQPIKVLLRANDPIKISIQAFQNSTQNKNVNSSAARNITDVLKKCNSSFNSVSPRCLPEQHVLQKNCAFNFKEALKKSLNITCSAEERSCVGLKYKRRIEDLCRNLTEFKTITPSPPSKVQLFKDETVAEIFTFRNVLLQLLPLLLLLLLHEAYWYNRDYLSNKEMDNVYITGKLKALDCDRKERGLRSKLFPLRKLEFRMYVLPSSFLQTSQETKEVLRWLIVWTMLGLSVLLSVYLDKSIYEALIFLNYSESNSCVIQLTPLNMDIIYSVCLILTLLIIIILVQSYALRSRSRICSFFYPKKESARGMYLYYKILHDRAHFWKKCRERGRMLSEARRTRWKIGIGHRVFRSLPNTLKQFIEKAFIYRCMICNSLTCRKSFVCKDEECFATFCYECYIDMGQSCISCRPNGARDSVFTSV
eukprot:Seg3491.2 transcript_id=Seg3491.2/GoldUCD/mRNA.D3Y31 product="E3 ubiquitin-protein ligase DCST1" protein_id=Seg3491.2/GoldUCD/D3Y31